jgi:hypothetical protein
MARLFTLSFVYNEVQYNMLVTVKTTPYYKEYTLNNLDPELLLYLPGNKIISPTATHFLFPDTTPQHSTALMAIIIKAVAQHLQTVAG